VLELSVQHHAVVVLVVQLEHLHEVLVGATVLVLLHLREDGQELVQLELLHLLLVLASELLDEGEGGVEVERPQAVSDEEGVHGVVTLEVVNGEGELHPLNIAPAKSIHIWCVFLKCFLRT